MDLIDQSVDADPGEEEILERVAAIDVAKDSGMVCVRVPHQTQPGKRDTSVWSVPARTNSIIALASQLAEQGIQRVVLESTSDYWRPFYYLLDARGLTVWLVNARDVKQAQQALGRAVVQLDAASEAVAKLDDADLSARADQVRAALRDLMARCGDAT